MFPRSVYKFIFLLFGLSVPFWVFAAMAPGLSEYLPMNLPVSSLVFVAPLVAALAIMYQEKGASGMRMLLARTFDFRKTKDKRWYIPLILFMPFVFAVEYGILMLLGRELPSIDIVLAGLPVLFVMYFVAAACEELGWMGFAAERATKKRSLLAVAIVLGVVWAVWHVIPFFQAGHSVEWVLWQSVSVVLYRVIIFWFYGNMGRSVFVAIIFHDMVNMSVTLFSNDSSSIDPLVTSVLLACVVAGILCTKKGRYQMTTR